MMEQQDHDLLIRIATMVENLNDRLFGDEETGDLPKLKTELNMLKEYKNKVIGAFAILSFLLTVFGGMLISHIMTHTEIVGK